MSKITQLFGGMEAFLEGDVEINNDVSLPAGEADAAAADQAVEAADIAETASEVEEKDVADTAAEMLFDRMYTMYRHVKRYGIDRTFLSLHNSHGELDRVCGIRFPACEDMNAVGDRYSRYSVAFIAAMEDDQEGWWPKFKKWCIDAFNWIIEKIKELAGKFWDFITNFRGKAEKYADKGMWTNYAEPTDAVKNETKLFVGAKVKQHWAKQLVTLIKDGDLFTDLKRNATEIKFKNMNTAMEKYAASVTEVVNEFIQALAKGNTGSGGLFKKDRTELPGFQELEDGFVVYEELTKAAAPNAWDKATVTGTADVLRGLLNVMDTMKQNKGLKGLHGELKKAIGAFNSADAEKAKEAKENTKKVREQLSDILKANAEQLKSLNKLAHALVYNLGKYAAYAGGGDSAKE